MKNGNYLKKRRLIKQKRRRFYGTRVTIASFSLSLLTDHLLSFSPESSTISKLSGDLSSALISPRQCRRRLCFSFGLLDESSSLSFSSATLLLSRSPRRVVVSVGLIDESSSLLRSLTALLCYRSRRRLTLQSRDPPRLRLSLSWSRRRLHVSLAILDDSAYLSCSPR